MRMRAVLAAIFLAIGLWYAVQTLLLVALVLTWSGDPPAETWTWVAVQGAAAAGCLVVAARLGRAAAGRPETSSVLASSPWELARYLMGLYALYRAVLALGTVIGQLLGDARVTPVYDLGGPLPVASIVELVVATVFGVVLLVGPGRHRGRLPPPTRRGRSRGGRGVTLRNEATEPAMSRRGVAGAALVAASLWHGVESARTVAQHVVSDHELFAEMWVPHAAQLAVCVVGVVLGGRLALRAGPERAAPRASAWDVARLGIGVLVLFRSALMLVLHLGIEVVAASRWDTRSPRADLAWAMSGRPASPIAWFALTTTFGTVLLVGPGRIGRWFLRTFGGTSTGRRREEPSGT